MQVVEEELEPEEDSQNVDNELKAAIKKRLVHVGRIEKIVAKAPWERRPEEVELVRKEIGKMEVFRKIDVRSLPLSSSSPTSQ